MFTQISIAYPVTDKVVEIKYDFKAEDEGLCFSMGKINVEEMTLEDYAKQENGDSNNKS